MAELLTGGNMLPGQTAKMGKFIVRSTELFRYNSVALAGASNLRVGDLAVTLDGVHVMAYLGDGSWIEADPDVDKVIEVALPTDNHWFEVPVIFVRWRWLDDGKTPNRSVRTAGSRGSNSIQP